MQIELRWATRGASALMVCAIAACSSDDAASANAFDSGATGDAGASANDASSSHDGGASNVDASAHDGGPSTDANGGDAGNGGPGPAPTAQCTIAKDADGFFKLTSAKSDYWVRLPVGYDVQHPQPAPLLVAIHGCGDTAYNFATWGAAPYALRASQSYIAMSIGGRDGQCWTIPQDGAIVGAAVAHLRSCFYAHQKKIVVAGYSSGGQLAYALGMTDAATYAGILIENSGLSQAVPNVDTALANAAWKINVAHSARTEDGSFAIAGVRADRDKMLAAGFPLQYRELAGTHNGTTDDWALFLIPKMASWSAP